MLGRKRRRLNNENSSSDDTDEDESVSDDNIFTGVGSLLLIHHNYKVIKRKDLLEIFGRNVTISDPRLEKALRSFGLELKEISKSKEYTLSSILPLNLQRLVTGNDYSYSAFSLTVLCLIILKHGEARANWLSQRLDDLDLLTYTRDPKLLQSQYLERMANERLLETVTAAHEPDEVRYTLGRKAPAVYPPTLMKEYIIKVFADENPASELQDQATTLVENVYAKFSTH